MEKIKELRTKKGIVHDAEALGKCPLIMQTVFVLNVREVEMSNKKTKKNPKGAGRKPDPSKNITIRIKIAAYNKLVEKYGKDLTKELRAVILNCV